MSAIVTPASAPVAAGTGVRRSVVVPSPSPPYRFSPQQYAAPAVDRAHEWVEPATSRVNATSPSPLASTGSPVRRSTLVPSPSRPSSLLPQHWIVLNASAQLCDSAAATSVTALDSGGAATASVAATGTSTTGASTPNNPPRSANQAVRRATTRHPPGRPAWATRCRRRLNDPYGCFVTWRPCLNCARTGSAAPTSSPSMTSSRRPG